jgi:surfactin synthase thioesterase subunit
VNASSGSPWFHVLRQAPDPRLRLVCFPSAGSGASVYRSWLPWLPPWLELVAVQAPGREARGRETALRRLGEIVEALAADMDEVTSALPFAFFGHSLGGRVAFELARRLEAGNKPAPSHVVLAASMEPSAMSDLDQRCHLLPDAEFEAYAATFGGFPEELRRFPRQFKVVMDLLRADLEVFATDVSPADPPLRASLTVLGAREDEAVTPRCLEPWSMRTTGRFAIEWFDGGHFFPIQQPEAVVARLSALLE